MSRKKRQQKVRKTFAKPYLESGIWIILASAALALVWSLGFIPVPQVVFFLIISAGIGAGAGTLIASRMYPKNL